jgi:SH3-like domain-containing protein
MTHRAEASSSGWERRGQAAPELLQGDLAARRQLRRSKAAHSLLRRGGASLALAALVVLSALAEAGSTSPLAPGSAPPPRLRPAAEAGPSEPQTRPPAPAPLQAPRSDPGSDQTPPPDPAAILPAAQRPPAADRAPPQGTDPTRGPVTNLPLPRFVSLKSSEGNARRGPGYDHRIDWVFTRPGMPLRVTAEYENWRRVEDAEGAGGWVHYSLLSGSRSVLVRGDMADLRSDPGPDGTLIARLQAGVVARLLACAPQQCRIQADGRRGWVDKRLLWGIHAEEVLE